MEVYIEKENTTKQIKMEKDRKIKEILEEFGISVNSVILVKNDAICLENEIVSDEDKIKILSVVSGG